MHNICPTKQFEYNQIMPSISEFDYEQLMTKEKKSSKESVALLINSLWT